MTSTYTKGTLKKWSAKDLCNDAYATFLCVFWISCQSICYGYSSELHRQVDAIQMGTHNICLYNEVDKQYTDCNLKSMELLDCALIGVCAVIRFNMVVLSRVKGLISKIILNWNYLPLFSKWWVQSCKDASLLLLGWGYKNLRRTCSPWSWLHLGDLDLIFKVSTGLDICFVS